MYDGSNACIVFDLDDTLYLEREYAYSGFRAVDRWCATYLNATGLEACAHKLFDRGCRTQIFDVALRRLGITFSDDVIAAMVQVYREHLPEIELESDSRDCLSRLKDSVQLALITDGRPSTQWKKIDALGLREVFDSIVVTGDLGPEFFKPHPRAFRQIEEYFGPQQSFMYVADNPKKDFLAPCTLGWQAVRIRRPGGLYSSAECSSVLNVPELGSLDTLPDVIADAIRFRSRVASAKAE